MIAKTATFQRLGLCFPKELRWHDIRQSLGMAPPQKLLDRVRDAVRTRHYSRRTEGLTTSESYPRRARSIRSCGYLRSPRVYTKQPFLLAGIQGGDPRRLGRVNILRSLQIAVIGVVIAGA